MYNKLWIYYIFFIRIITFNNPFLEIIALFKSRKIKRVALFDTKLNYQNYNIFKSSLIETKPKVSVIIPTLNRYDFLKDALSDLENQIYKNFEVIIVDQSDNYDRKFYDKFKLELKVVHQKIKALWSARNNAIKMASSEFLLFFDDDSRVDNNWIIEHLKCIDYFSADISSGISKPTKGAKIPPNYKYFKISEQLDTGNVLIKRDVFMTCGLFDKQFERMRMGDNEFGIRSARNNFLNIQNPNAHRIHFKADEGGLREMGSWDGFHSKNIFSPLPVPSVLYMSRKYWGEKRTFFYLIRTLPMSLSFYKLKGSIHGVLLSLILLVVFFLLFYID